MFFQAFERLGKDIFCIKEVEMLLQMGLGFQWNARQSERRVGTHFFYRVVLLMKMSDDGVAFGYGFAFLHRVDA